MTDSYYTTYYTHFHVGFRWIYCHLLIFVRIVQYTLRKFFERGDPCPKAIKLHLNLISFRYFLSFFVLFIF